MGSEHMATFVHSRSRREGHLLPSFLRRAQLRPPANAARPAAARLSVAQRRQPHSASRFQTEPHPRTHLARGRVRMVAVRVSGPRTELPAREISRRRGRRLMLTVNASQIELMQKIAGDRPPSFQLHHLADGSIEVKLTQGRTRETPRQRRGARGRAGRRRAVRSLRLQIKRVYDRMRAPPRRLVEINRDIAFGFCRGQRGGRPEAVRDRISRVVAIRRISRGSRRRRDAGADLAAPRPGFDQRSSVC